MFPWRARSLSPRRLLVGAALVVLAPAVGCKDTNTPVARSGGEAGGQTMAGNPAPAEIGDSLYKRENLPRTVAEAVKEAKDPIVIDRAPVSSADKQEVPSQVDSVVWAIATELKPGEEATLREDQKFKHPITGQVYRRIDEGEEVQPGQLVVILDDQKVRAKYQGLKDVLPATLEMSKLSQQFAGVTKQLESMQESLFRQNGPGSKLEYLQAQAQNLHGMIEQFDKLVSSLNTKASLDEAKVEMDRHMIRATTSGKIRHVNKHVGESVKAGDMIMEIENPNRMRVEGQIGVQYAGVLKKGMPVLIQPEKQVGPEKTLSTGASAITAIAVGQSKKQPEPLIVTAGADSRVVVQDRLGKLFVPLPHPVAVRALACSPPTAATSFCVTGGDDGKLRRWDLNALTGTPKGEELKGRHRNAVSAVAFSLDGKFCATGDDQSILLWNVATGEQLYEFPAMHHGPITMLQFTPQSKLLSSGRDNTLLVWDLGQKGARVETALEQRSGQVSVICATANGREVLFDQSNKTLRLLALPERRSLGILEASETNSFANFAHFSPDGQLILVGTASPDRLQLWRTPTTGVRGYSTRQFICRSSANVPYAVRCAAFAPDGSFAVAGTAEGDALILPIPTRDELNQRLEGVVTLIDTSEITNPNSKQSRVRAELDNSAQRLASGDVVTIVAQP
jgi:biotin carboxyl carrier protein